MDRLPCFSLSALQCLLLHVLWLSSEPTTVQATTPLPSNGFGHSIRHTERMIRDRETPLFITYDNAVRSHHIGSVVYLEEAATTCICTATVAPSFATESSLTADLANGETMPASASHDSSPTSLASETFSSGGINSHGRSATGEPMTVQRTSTVLLQPTAPAPAPTFVTASLLPSPTTLFTVSTAGSVVLQLAPTLAPTLVWLSTTTGEASIGPTGAISWSGSGSGEEPTTPEPATSEPTTFEPTASELTTPEPATSEPTTLEDTTSEPTTSGGATSEPTTVCVCPTATSGTLETPTQKSTPQPTPKPCEFYPFDSHPSRTGFDDECFLVEAKFSGFPYFQKRLKNIYLCSNGLISGNRPFYRYVPEFFSLSLLGQDIIAPFWADIVIGNGSRISYRLFVKGNAGDEAILQKASRDVHEKSLQESEEFDAVQALIVTWYDVANYPDERVYFRGGYDELSDLRNTFQLLLVTDDVKTFAFFIYGTDGLQWSGRWQQSAIAGYVATNRQGTGIVAVNNVLGSGTPNIADADDLFSKANGQQCGAFLSLSLDPEAIDLNKQKCLNWYLDDIKTLGETVTWGQGNAQECPCSAWQAWSDFRYRRLFGFPWRRSSCFHTAFSRPIGPLDRFVSTETICCYRDGSLLSSPPDGSRSSPYHRLEEPSKFILYTAGPENFCCLQGDQSSCELFYERRPSINCDGYRPLTLCWGFGDPHLQTADGTKYTFNGRGEYVLIRGEGNQFEMQCRTNLAANSNATVFSAFAMASFPKGTTENYSQHTPLSGIIHAELAGSNSLIVYSRKNSTSNWANITSQYDALSNVSTLNIFGSIVSKPEPGVLVIRYSEGMSVTVTSKKGLITAVFAGPDDQKGETGGLLGVWDDDTSNDYTARNGTVLPLNSTDRQIHYGFGQTWQISPEESLFYYDGKASSDFAFLDHQPPFIDELDFSAVTDPKLISACGGDVVCLYDGVQTGDVEVAAETKATETANIAAKDQLANFPPVISGNKTLFAFLKTLVTFSFTVSDPNDTFTITLNGSLPPKSDFNFTQFGDTFTFNWKPSSLSPVSLQFVALDSAGASTLLHPLVRLCGCRLDLNATCVNSGGTGGSSRFLLQTCKCGSGWTGDMCDQNENGCATFSCFPGVECIDNLPPLSGARCGPCPNGTERSGGDSEACIDINECRTNASKCTQLCTNMLGSFSCSCEKGYVLNPDGYTCDDINECSALRPCHQLCSNTNGSFECGCLEGFKLDTDNVTCLARENCQSNCPQGCAVVKGIDTCFCTLGFQLDFNGRNCSDIDECKSPLHECTQFCINTVGSFACNCSSGYALNADDRTCDDIDECFPTSSCSLGQICINTLGSFSCKCPEGTDLVNGSCEVGVLPVPPTTMKPESPAIDFQNGLVRAVIENVSKSRFDQAKFKEAVAAAMSVSCNRSAAACVMISNVRRKRDALVITKDNVVLVNVTEEGNNLTISFYIATEGGSVLLASAISDGLSTDSAKATLKSFGFTISKLVVVRPGTLPPFTVAPSPTEAATTKTGLTTGQIVGIICGSVGGVILLVMLIVFIYWIVQSKKLVKVTPSTGREQEMMLLAGSFASRKEKEPLPSIH